ncbi:MAG: hypothetical protein NTV93_21200 [Verrucomicrobia bacterium]|nr:hypothetical protein [Verrucomicrobiota bacterium]
MKDGLPLLVDPTAEEPWQFLDFDPTTGNIVARFDPALGDWTAKGGVTVEILHLNSREALASGCMKTYRRLKALVESATQQPAPNPRELEKSLQEADDHGLLGWCFAGTGIHTEPFSTLRKTHPRAWQHLQDSYFSANKMPMQAHGKREHEEEPRAKGAKHAKD